MPPGIIFFGLWFIGLLGAYFVMRWVMWRITGSRHTLGDTLNNYGRGFGDYNWQRWNERQTGEAEKSKGKEYRGLPRQVSSRRKAEQAPARLQVAQETDSDPVPLSDLLNDEQHHQ